MTLSVARALACVGGDLVDHVIVTYDGYSSFRDRGRMAEIHELVGKCKAVSQPGSEKALVASEQDMLRTPRAPRRSSGRWETPLDPWEEPWGRRAAFLVRTALVRAGGWNGQTGPVLADSDAPLPYLGSQGALPSAGGFALIAINGQLRPVGVLKGDGAVPRKIASLATQLASLTGAPGIVLALHRDNSMILSKHDENLVLDVLRGLHCVGAQLFEAMLFNVYLYEDEQGNANVRQSSLFVSGRLATLESIARSSACA